MNPECSLLDRVEILEGERHGDSRGWLHVGFRRQHLPESTEIGELYVVHSVAPGTRRGDHFHPQTNEWFSVVSGFASFEFLEPKSQQRKVLEIRAEEARTVFVPAGLAHAIINLGPGALTVVAFADRPQDPNDVVTCSTQAPA